MALETSQRAPSPTLDVRITFPADGATDVPQPFSPSGTRNPGTVAVTLTMAGQPDHSVPGGGDGTNWTDPSSYNLGSGTHTLTATVTDATGTASNSVTFSVA